MSAYKLKLTATPGAWRLFSLRKADPGFAEFRDHVWRRDGYTCQFCGFQAKQHQEIVNLDDNYRNNKINNLVTSCVFCTQCFFLEAVGRGEYGGGTLIYLPELTQIELNGFCHVLFCAMSNATEYSADAQSIYRTLKLRSKIVEKYLGEGMNNPAILGQMLIDTQIDKREIISEQILKNLRLLPTRDKFTKQIADWAAAAMDELQE